VWPRERKTTRTDALLVLSDDGRRGSGEQSTSNSVPLPARRIFIDEPSAVCQKNSIRRIDQVINKVSSSPAQTQTGQVSTSYPFIALAPPSFPSRPGTSILVGCRSEGALTVDNSALRWTSKDIRSRCRGMSFGQYHRTTAE
jgi:hypothetical protein